jgi:hypothetical protein
MLLHAKLVIDLLGMTAKKFFDPCLTSKDGGVVTSLVRGAVEEDEC